MKKELKYLVIGILFGIVLVKSEVVSWFRIQEMFRFHSFHMYGVIGIAVLVGITSVQIIRRFHLHSLDGEPVDLTPKPFNKANFIGGVLFGLGWAMTGACPGPIYSLIGSGYLVFAVVLVSAVLGTFTYGVLKDRLPH
ncbi:MAG TPA: DUF6691 family protein [Chitinophagales bacterium]|nr:DUF6691 family protein [Chitinophagales bacterium]